MEELKKVVVNNETYVHESAYAERGREIDRLKKIDEKGLEIIGKPVIDPANILAIGSIELKHGKFVRTRVSINLLEKAIAVMKATDVDSVDIVFSEESILTIGSMDDEKKIVSGAIIAPKVVN